MLKPSARPVWEIRTNAFCCCALTWLYCCAAARVLKLQGPPYTRVESHDHFLRRSFCCSNCFLLPCCCSQHSLKMLVTTAVLFFAVIVNATPYFSNTTSSVRSTSGISSLIVTSSSLSSTSRTSGTSSLIETTSSLSSTSRTSSFLSAITPSPSNISSSNSSGHNETITGSAYYDPYAFLNPYFYRVLAATGDARSSLMSCSSIWGSDFSAWSLTAEKTTGPVIAATTETSIILPYVSTQDGSTEISRGTKTTWTSTIPESVVTVLPQTTIITSAAMGPLYLAESSFDFTASEPCCYGCTLSGGTVQVFYWPTETQSPPISTLVNDVGFTLYVPSPMSHYISSL